MRIERLLIGLIILSAVFIIPFVNAEIFVGDVNSAYNLGDELNLTITVNSGSDASDFIISKIVCSESVNISANDSTQTNEAEIYRSALSMKAGQEKSIFIDIGLDKALIGDLNGNCLIRTTYNGVSADSNLFDITPNLDVGLSLSGLRLLPGDQLDIQGSAYRINGEPLNGFVEVSIPLLNQNVYDSVNAGIFNFSFKIPDDAHSGEYNIIAKAYNKDSAGNELNYGIASGAFNVKQVISKIDIAFDSQTIIPGNDCTFTSLLYDQAGDSVKDDVAVVLYYPNGTIIEKRLTKAGKSETLPIAKDDMPGYWKVDASANNLDISKTFYVEELEQAEFQLDNNTLTVTNVGNVPYNKPVEVAIGSAKEIVNINISVDGTKKYRLYAPNGDYDINVNDGNQLTSFGTSFLTGSTINIQDLQNLNSGSMFGIIIWGIIILLVAAIALYIYRRVNNHSFFGRRPEGDMPTYPTMSTGPRWNEEDLAKLKSLQMEENDQKRIPQNAAFEREERTMRERITKTLPSMAPPFITRKERQEEYARPSATVDAGHKQHASVVCLKINNLQELESAKTAAMGAIDRALSKAKSLRGKIYLDGNFRVVIFSPILTRESENETRAINAAKQMEEVLVEYNKLHVQKISFGIGVNAGELIAEAKDGSFKFTSIGSTISSAKRISENADGGILLSELFHRVTAGSVKVDPIKGYWKIRRIVNRERNSEFINKFMERQKKR